MKTLAGWISHHQVAAFFIITFTITWGLGFSYSAVLKHGQFLLLPLSFVATCGPALAGIIVTAVSSTLPRQGTGKAARIAFFVAWGMSELVFLANYTFLDRASLSPLVVVVALTLLSVIPVASIISAVYSPVPAVRSYLASLIRLRGVAGWSLLALVLIPGVSLLAMVFSGLAGRQPVTAIQPPAAGPLSGLVAVKFLYQFLFFNCIGEEIGWRGFAQPRLQARTSPLIASLIIALFWPAWHLFLWQAEGSPVLSWQYWLEQYGLHIAASVIIGWLYNRSRGSILVAGIAHAAANTASPFIPHFDWEAFMVTALAAALLMVLVDRMWKKLPPGHPAVVQAIRRFSEDAPAGDAGRYHASHADRLTTSK